MPENKEHKEVLDHEVDDLSASDDEVREIWKNLSEFSAKDADLL